MGRRYAEPLGVSIVRWYFITPLRMHVSFIDHRHQQAEFPCATRGAREPYGWEPAMEILDRAVALRDEDRCAPQAQTQAAEPAETAYRRSKAAAPHLWIIICYAYG